MMTVMLWVIAGLGVLGLLFWAYRTVGRMLVTPHIPTIMEQWRKNPYTTERWALIRAKEEISSRIWAWPLHMLRNENWINTAIDTYDTVASAKRRQSLEARIAELENELYCEEYYG